MSVEAGKIASKQEGRRLYMGTYSPHVLVVLILVCILCMMLSPTSGPHNYSQKESLKCQAKLKIIGGCILSYYSEGTTIFFPKIKSCDVSKENIFGFIQFYDGNQPWFHKDELVESDLNSHSFRTFDVKEAKYCYSWNPGISEKNISEWGCLEFPIMWDAEPHILYNPAWKFWLKSKEVKVNVLFGDGHVSSCEPLSIPGYKSPK